MKIIEDLIKPLEFILNKWTSSGFIWIIAGGVVIGVIYLLLTLKV